MPNLSEDQKILLLLNYERLMVKMGKVEPEYNTVEELCDAFNVNKNYPKNLRAMFLERGTLERKQGSGRPHVENYEQRQISVTDTIRKRRSSSICDISNATDIPKSSVHRIVANEQFRIVHSKTCPLITDDQKDKRLKWCRQHRRNTWDTWVDIDEKWFQLYSFTCERYRDNSPRKKIPLLSKANIPKLIVITAIAKPNIEKNFNGLVGIWRIQSDYEAKRSSINHKKGDVYKIDCTMTSEYFYELMHNEIMPAVSNRMYWCQNIFIQIDNARPHVGKNNVQKLNDFGDTLNPTVTVVNQPAQSPELNINDLGFFHSLNKRCQKHLPNNLDVLWDKLQVEFRSTKEETLNSLFSSKSRIVNQIISSRGAAVNVTHTC